MDPQEYESKLVKILDAEAKDDFGDEDNPKAVKVLTLLLQDVGNNQIFRATLQEDDVRQIIGAKNLLSSGEMVRLAVLLRQREDPLKLLVPKSSFEITKEDILKSKTLDKPKKKRNRRSGRKKPYFYNENNRKIN